MMRRKLGLITGGSERLGVRPLLVALYLQARDLGIWPPRLALSEMLAIWALVLAYGVGWWAVRSVLRMGMYEQLLSDALAERVQT